MFTGKEKKEQKKNKHRHRIYKTAAAKFITAPINLE